MTNNSELNSELKSEDINTMNCQPFYQRIQTKIDHFTTLWNLSNLKLIDDGRESCVYSCDSKQYGKAILKVRSDIKVIEDEFLTLKEYNGRGFCKAYHCDTTEGILLEEKIEPGIELRKEPLLERRVSLFCQLYKNFHIEPSKGYSFPTYLDWVNKITQYMQSRKDYVELYEHMRRAQELCIELFHRYPPTKLLHGDLHHDNILLNKEGTYTIIDPKGVLGDPIFDLPRFILNEMEDEINEALALKINTVITIISHQLHISPKLIKKLFYIEMSMAECWNVEDGVDAKLVNVLFAERLLASED